ncbi:hypothetical protein SEA_LITTLELAF_13 [Mycobacterium phage LittleLaf]|uniref:DUF1508 domain-containing protein n=8 Tax=Marvinvirus TaxID=1982091 RepID=A0A3G8FHA8_9CAUD|nr:hypothetical protein FDI61_gp013 [Mycobacterium phage Marvin]AYB69823.1 hypothetical protein SEA_LITTLELAF_13 [Mycobacterium phage LittleLaf]AYB70650.1 hypothetical protein SEA_VASUNZINGA_12 [Mycobacterium phage VasuNzinga]AZF93282.1 hypothetical protein SEA_BEELZEBUB_16 [Mycobacterium phage Beelzebub]QAX93064.1 hypothetical protein SEA_REDRAIDER77_13 [Mycobacterium phage RedRaider77]QFP94153.1 hypothetical protein SEA_JOIEB_14 [Mycobacterium phage JoieB]QFP96877.1 hypothetical protein SEA
MSNRRTVRIRIESNKAKTSFWYTLVAGNGNTIMRSTAKYTTEWNCRTAATRLCDALRFSPLAVEVQDPKTREISTLERYPSSPLKVLQKTTQTRS